MQGLSRKAVVDSESVEELLEEGQTIEAAAISGVEDALDPDQAELHTRQVPEDNVPEEYTEDDSVLLIAVSFATAMRLYLGGLGRDEQPQLQFKSPSLLEIDSCSRFLSRKLPERFGDSKAV